jgi:hypothetical protein
VLVRHDPTYLLILVIPLAGAYAGALGRKVIGEFYAANAGHRF